MMDDLLNSHAAAALLARNWSVVRRHANDLLEHDFDPRRLNGIKPGRDWSFRREEVERFKAVSRPNGRPVLQRRMSNARARAEEIASDGYMNDYVAPEQTRAEAYWSENENAVEHRALLNDALARLPALARFRAQLLDDIALARKMSETQDIRASSWHLHEMETLQLVLGNLDDALVNAQL